MYTEIAPFRVKTIRFPSGERFPAIVDKNETLAYAPALYGTLVLRPRLGSSGTMEAHLRAITIGLNWAASRKIDLTERIESVNLLTTFEVESLRAALRTNYRKNKPGREHKSKSSSKRQRTAVSTGTYYNRCHMVWEYFEWSIRRAIQRIRTSDPKLPEARHRLEAFERQMLADLPKPYSGEREGVDERTQELLIDAITPGSPLNPFQWNHQHRNHALLLAYYELCIRRAEGLKLKGENLVDLAGTSPAVQIVRDPDDPADPREVEPRVKTLPRVLPLSPALAKALMEWVVDHRTDTKRYPGAKRTPYVFVSRTGKPIALRTVNGMFELLRERVPGLPADFTTHILRHTGNDRFSAAADAEGLNEAQEKQARNYAMGWTKESTFTSRPASSLPIAMGG